MLAQLTTAIAAAPRRDLDHLSSTVWKANAQGLVSDADAQALAEAIHARRQEGRPQTAPQALISRPSIFPPRRLQRSPDRAASIERRRRLALSGPLPPALRAMFTTGELAVLRIVADEVRHHGACDRSLAEIAARAGVCRTLAHNTLRLAARHGLVTIEERRRPGRRNATNLVRVISREWLAWLRRGPSPSRGEVFKKSSPTAEHVSLAGTVGAKRNRRKGFRGEASKPSGARTALSGSV